MNARTLPSIDVSPDALLARAKRIEGATITRRVRDAELALAREIYRRHGIQHDGELLQALQNIEANCDDSPYKERLMKLILTMDRELHETPPEIRGLDKRGEYDNRTAGVSHRSAA